MKLFFKKKAKVEENQNEDFFLSNQSSKETNITPKNKQETDAHQEEGWLDEDYEEGQLSVDVYQNKEAIVIKSTIAGVKPEDIDISINNDMVTIRGKREVEQSILEDDYFFQECYWGGFSRSIILPMEIQPDKVQATLKNGVLTITLPKAAKAKAVSVKVKEEEE